MSEPTILRIPSPDDQSLEPILEHLARHRLTELSALRRLPGLDRLKIGRLRELLREGRRKRLIESAPLYQGARYWYLQPDGAATRGLSAERSGPLGEAAKLRAYAMLRYCWLSGCPRHLLTADELKRYLPTAHRPGLPSGYYFEPDGKGRLGLLRIDAARKGRWDRSLHSLRQDINSHVLYDAFRQLVAAGRFQITLLTALPQKAARMREALLALPDARRVPVEVIAMSELLPLAAPGRRKEVAAATG